MNFKSFPYHPFLVVAFQILTVYSININEVNFNTVFIVLIISLVFTTIIYGLISLLLDKRHGAIIVSCYGFLFFVYGRILDILIENPIFGLPLHRNKYFLPIYVLLLIGITFLLYTSNKCKKNLKVVTLFANKLSAGLVIIAILTAGINFDWTKLQRKENFKKEVNYSESKIDQPTKNIIEKLKPNVYFLIFDSYASHRVLNKYYDWNDSLFVNAIVSRGFSVNKNARSNYCFTGASILSTLSMRYLHLDQGFIDSYNQDNYIGQHYKKNRVVDRFKSEGYDIVTNLVNDRWLHNNSKKSLISEDFVQLIIHISMLRIIENELVTDQLRQDVLSMLNGMKQLDKLQKPTFICLHFMVPHSPFIFQADGSRPKYFESAFTKFEYKEKFVEQVKFAGSQIIDIVDSIRRKDKDAIIIIQSDHGFGEDDDMIYLNRNSVAANNNNREKPPSDYLDARFGILSAIYLPPDINMPESITPVNLFRYLFNSLFEDKLEILPDRSFFAVIKQPYLFHDITGDLNEY